MDGRKDAYLILRKGIYNDVEDWVCSALVSNKAIHCHTYCRSVYSQHFYATYYVTYCPSAGEAANVQKKIQQTSTLPLSNYSQ